MQRNVQTYIIDILASIQEIESFIEGIEDIHAYSEDNKTKRAIERNLEIIGEAVKSIPESVRQELPEIEWKKVSGLRDVLIHAYFNIEDEIIWGVVKYKLPQLKYACQTIFDKLLSGEIENYL
jgi:uncharacterized protein with HEPN domain